MFLENFSQYSHTGFIIFRVVIGFIFLYHGWPKMQKSKMVAQGMGFPASSVFVIGLAEALAGLSVIFNHYIQLGSAIIIVVMLGALYMKAIKWKIAFYSNTNTGWEYDLVLLAAAVAMLLGMGK